MKAGMLPQPFFDLGIPTSGVVVVNQIQRFILKCLSVYLAKEFRPLGKPMSLLAQDDDFIVQDIESGKQRSGVVALVVMCHRGGATFLLMQARLRAISCLDLAFFVAVAHQGVFRRAQIQTCYIAQFLSKLRYARHYESSEHVGLPSVRSPIPPYCHGTDSIGLGHCVRAPVGGVGRQGLRGLTHELQRNGRVQAVTTRRTLFDSRQTRAEQV